MHYKSKYDLIFELKKKFTHIDQEFINPINTNLNELFRINYNYLEIDINGGYPKYFFNDKGIYAIQLRPIRKNEKTLIIGCGNNPTPIYYHYPFFKQRFDLIKKCKCHDKQQNHLHKNCVTIDPDLSMNPTIVTMFGKCELPFLKDNSFEKIITEGLNISYFSHFETEKKRLLVKIPD